MVDVEALTLHIEPSKFWDENEEVFVDIPGGDLVLKHTLSSVSKWESKWKKEYLQARTESELTAEEALDYIRCMTINDVEPDIYFGLTKEDFMLIKEHIEDPMTATRISERAFKSNTSTMNGETVTAELVYYWMIAYQIPYIYEHWHFNKLMTLIKVCSVKSEKPKKMSRGEMLSQRRALNAKRKAKHHTRG